MLCSPRHTPASPAVCISVFFSFNGPGGGPRASRSYPRLARCGHGQPVALLCILHTFTALCIHITRMRTWEWELAWRRTDEHHSTPPNLCGSRSGEVKKMSGDRLFVTFTIYVRHTNIAHTHNT